MSEPARSSRSYAEYLAHERASDVKHEYIAGEILAMAGGSIEHGRLAMRFGRLLGNELADRPCDTFSSDVRVRVPSGDAYYPDLTVVCGHLERDPEDADAITNPVVIVDVLSRSNEAPRRGRTFRQHRRFASLREHVVVYPGEPFVEVWRLMDGRWTLAQEAGPGATIELASVDAKVAMDELYRRPLAS